MPKAPRSSPTCWLVVVSAANVTRGVAGGFVQVNHGKRLELDRMRAGDVVSSGTASELEARDSDSGDDNKDNAKDKGEHSSADQPGRVSRTTFERSFTATGLVLDGEPFQEDTNGSPWRRNVLWCSPARHVTFASVEPRLRLCQGRSWRSKVMKGLARLDDADYRFLHDGICMGVSEEAAVEAEEVKHEYVEGDPGAA